MTMMRLVLKLSLMTGVAFAATTNIKATSCCASVGGCLMADQVLGFPSSAVNPPEFDYKVTGTLPQKFASGSFVITGALAGVNVLNHKGKACGTVTVPIRKLIKLATITINFPECPEPSTTLLVTGHVSVPIAPPLGMMFKTHLVVTDDASGGVISCIDIDVGGGTASPAAIAPSSCCPASGCDLSPQVLNFPPRSVNPVVFDFSVSGALATAETAPQYSVVGKLASGTVNLKILDGSGTACHPQTLKLSYLSVNIGTITIDFPACPYAPGPVNITGSVACTIALPESMVLNTHVQVTDDAGGVSACLDLAVSSADGPAPPAPAPPAPPAPAPSSTYVCVGGQCVPQAGGVDKQLCLAACGSAGTSLQIV